MDGDETRKERAALMVIVVFAVLALVSVLAAFSYYCYIRAKVSKHRKALKSKSYPFSLLSSSLRLDPFFFQRKGTRRRKRPAASAAER